MAHTLLVVGTASHVGKSTVSAGLCRLLSDCGLSVAPFKGQNMSNNARVAAVPDPPTASGATRDRAEHEVPDDDAEWGEIGVSQHVQARAAGVAPTVEMNPVLLKPRGDGESQLVLWGSAVGHYDSGAYYDEHWHRARAVAAEAHAALAAEYDVVVAEGAGSAAEPNLSHRDIANVETAAVAADHGTVRTLLVADIERGGAFASVVGTLDLMPDRLRETVAGVVLTKFRGDESLLDPAVETVEDRTGVPVLGVIPHDDPGLPAEDSLSLPGPEESAVEGADDGVPADRAVTVAVPRLPRASNVTDLEPLARLPGVRVAYRRPTDFLAGDGPEPDAVVLPGSKNTVDDLLALREAGVGDALRRFDGPVVGLCGGYQMLGERLRGADAEGTGDRETVPGFGLLPVETTFSPEKRVERVAYDLDGVGPLAGATGRATGYEIHAGDTAATAAVARPVGPDSAARGDVLGTYLHGLFETPAARRAFRVAAYEFADRDPPAVDASADADRDPYAAAAALVADNVALDPLVPAEVTT
ncbi:MAG: cobyric acid synthase [Halolamina sp.]